MKKFYSLLALAAITMVPATGFAQDGDETGDAPITISFDATNPAPGAFKDAPTSFTLDFSKSSIKVTRIVDNTDYTKTLVDGADPMYTGTFAYVIYSNPDGSVVLNSAPLKASVNKDNTLRLDLDTADTPYFAGSLNSDDFYTLSLVVPYGLFNVFGTNITGKEAEYLNLARTFNYIHTGDSKIISFTTDPANETQIEKLNILNVKFNLPDLGKDNLTWVCQAKLKPTVFQKTAESGQWVVNGNGTCRVTDAADPSTANIRVLPAMTTQAQYRVEVPFAAWTLTAFDGETQVASYITEAQTLRYAVGEEVNLGGIKKDQFFAFAVPAEGNINLSQVPSGVDYLRLTFTEIPEINRNLDEPIRLYYNGGTEPLFELSPRDQNYVRLQTKGVQNEYGHELNMWFNDDEYIDAPGDYTVEFPANFLYFPTAQEYNAKFELVYHIDKTLNITLYPSVEYASIPEIKDIFMNFANATELVVNPEQNQPIKLETAGGSFFKAKSVTCNGKVAHIEFDRITEDNWYTFTVPAGYFLATVDNEILPNQPIEGIYKVYDMPKPAIEPAEGVLTNPSVYEFTLTLPLTDKEEITASTNSSFTRLCKVSDTGEIEYLNRISYFKPLDIENSIGSDQITLIPVGEKSITLAPGNYVLIIAQYLYTITGGEMSDEYFYFFTVLPNGEMLAKPAISPFENVVDSNLFTLTFDQNITAFSKGTSYLYPKNEDGTLGEAVAAFQVTPGASSKEVDLVNLIPEDLPGGVYELQTPKGLVNADKSTADAYSFTIWCGMSEVLDIIEEAQAQSVGIYTIEGVCINPAATEADVKALPKGFYIINGKKLVVR